ncbi:MAG: hypothetical protein ACM3NH_04670 [Candidatus Saccharibacteria bacterium]
MLKKTASAIALLGLVVLAPLVSHAANLGSLTISPSTAKRGETVTVSGSFGANNTGSAVRFSLDSGTATMDLSAQGTVTTDQAGYFTARVMVPSNFAVSNATLTATAANGDTLTGNLNVTNSSSTAGSTTSSSTGTSATPTGGVRAGSGGLAGLGTEIALAGFMVLTGISLLVTAKRNTEAGL